MTPEEFERAQDARFTPWMPEHLLCTIVRGEPITLTQPIVPWSNAPEAYAIYTARRAIMTASWTSACAVKTERNHGPQ
jgi:hypothetical protein